MTCHGCGTEYDSSIEVCAECGRTLVFGAVPGEAPAADPAPPDSATFNAELSTTLSVSGGSSIRSRLRPKSVGEIFSESFALYREHWKLLWGIVLVYGIPLAILQFVIERLIASSGGPVSNRGGGSGIENFVVLLTQFCLIRTVSEIYLGRKVQLSDALRLNSRFWSYLGANFLYGLALVGAIIVVAIPLIAVLSDHQPGVGPILLAVGSMLGMLAVCFVLSIWFGLGGTVAAVEGIGARSALSRSRDLVRGFFRPALNVLLGAGFLYLGTMIVLWIIAVFACPGIASVQAYETVSMTTARQLLDLGTMMLALPLGLLPLVLFYYDLRVRKEAFDLQMLAEQLGYRTQVLQR